MKLFLMQWGYVVITTPNGVLDHEEAIRQNVGGQVLGYFYWAYLHMCCVSPLHVEQVGIHFEVATRYHKSSNLHIVC